jgi:hypothetical protein
MQKESGCRNKGVLTFLRLHKRLLRYAKGMWLRMNVVYLAGMWCDVQDAKAEPLDSFENDFVQNKQYGFYSSSDWVACNPIWTAAKPSARETSGSQTPVKRWVPMAFKS